MVLGGYFDESIRPDGHEPICVGGFLFKQAAYSRFSRQWRRTVLRVGNRRLAHFHMTDLCAGQGEYKGLTIAERVSILERAVDAVGSHAYAAIGVTFDQREFEAVAPKGWPRYFGSIYTAACQMCLQTTGHWLRKWDCPMRVLYVFERGHKFENEAHRLLSAIGQDEEAAKHCRYRNHVFESKATEPGLQAADLFAWATTKARSVDGGAVPKAFKPFLPSVIRFGSLNPGRQMLHVFTEKRLVRFFDELANGKPMVTVRFGPRLRTFR